MHIYACMHFWFCLPINQMVNPSSHSLKKINHHIGIEPAERVHCGWAGLNLRILRFPLPPALWPWLDNFFSFPFAHPGRLGYVSPSYLIMFQRELINSSCAQEFTISQAFSSKTLETVHPFVCTHGALFGIHHKTENVVYILSSKNYTILTDVYNRS